MTEYQLLQKIRQLAGAQRAKSFDILAQAAIDRGLSEFVETGCYRGNSGDGYSTLIFALLAVHVGGAFDSVDINPVHMDRAKNLVPLTEGPHLAYHCEDSIGYLSRRDKRIDVLYLDSYDFEPSNPNPAQAHQLAEIQAAMPKLTPNSLVLLDDADLPHAGKTKLSAEWLLENGWKELYRGYQLLFTK